MDNKKPDRVITCVHTGTGNSGTTDFQQKRLLKSSLEIHYVGSLDEAQSLICYDETEYLSNTLLGFQDSLFTLGASAYNIENTLYLTIITNLYEVWKEFLKYYLADIEPLTGFLRTCKSNQTFMQLRACIRRSERIAVELDYKEHVKLLNILSDVAFALAWLKTLEDHKPVLVWEGLK